MQTKVLQQALAEALLRWQATANAWSEYESGGERIEQEDEDFKRVLGILNASDGGEECLEAMRASLIHSDSAWAEFYRCAEATKP